MRNHRLLAQRRREPGYLWQRWIRFLDPVRIDKPVRPKPRPRKPQPSVGEHAHQPNHPGGASRNSSSAQNLYRIENARQKKHQHPRRGEIRFGRISPPPRAPVISPEQQHQSRGGNDRPTLQVMLYRIHLGNGFRCGLCHRRRTTLSTTPKIFSVKIFVFPVAIHPMTDMMPPEQTLNRDGMVTSVEFSCGVWSDAARREPSGMTIARIKSPLNSAG